MRLLLGAMAGVDVVGEAGDGDRRRARHRHAAARRRPARRSDARPERLRRRREASAEHLPLVVFVTAYDEYALRAFEVHAFDYLLKPVNGARLADAMARVRADLARGAPPRERRDRRRRRRARGGKPRCRRHGQRNGCASRCAIAIATCWCARRISTGSTPRPTTSGSTPAGTRFLLRMTLAEMERQLDPRDFTRIHRSTIVNTSRIKRDQAGCARRLRCRPGRRSHAENEPELPRAAAGPAAHPVI